MVKHSVSLCYANVATILHDVRNCGRCALLKRERKERGKCSGDSRRAPRVVRDGGKDAGEDEGESEGSASFASSAANGGSGSAEEGDNGLLSIIVPDMVKHSVSLCYANVAAISSIRCFPRPAICRGRAAAGLSSAVRLARPRANVAWPGPEFRPGSAHLPGPRAVEERRHRGNPRVVAFRSRHRCAFCGPRPAISACATVTIRTARPSITSSLLHRFCCAPSSWLPQSFEPLLAATPYLFFGVMLGASLWYVARRLYGNAWRIHRPRALLLFAGHDRQRRPARRVWAKWAPCGERSGRSSPPSPWRTPSTLPAKLCSGTGDAFCCWGCLWRWQRATSFRWGCWRW